VFKDAVEFQDKQQSGGVLSPSITKARVGFDAEGVEAPATPMLWAQRLSLNGFIHALQLLADEYFGDMFGLSPVVHGTAPALLLFLLV
jgi:hypothetical protein